MLMRYLSRKNVFPPPKCVSKSVYFCITNVLKNEKMYGFVFVQIVGLRINFRAQGKMQVNSLYT